jgi:TPR repeat protein/serine/threonine protein kinase
VNFDDSAQTVAVDSTSTDLALRCYAPQVVAHAYRRASSAPGDSRDRLGWRLGFIDVAQRYLLAVLQAQHRHLNLPRVPAYERLLAKFSTPSLGDFGRALEGIALALAPHELDPRVRELVDLIVEASGEDGAWRPSPFTTSLTALVESRNYVAHTGGAAIPSEVHADAELHKIEPHVTLVCRGLRVLQRLPLLWVEHAKLKQNRRTAVRLLRFSGQDPELLEFELEAGAVSPPVEVPFVVLNSGALLLLAPFVVVTSNSRTGIKETGLLYRWNFEGNHFDFNYLDGSGCGPASPGTELPCREIRGLREMPPELAGHGQVFSPDIVALIIGRADSSELPNVTGYQLLGKLGRGASSTVYRGVSVDVDGKHGGFVAVKVLDPVASSEPTQRRRLEQEYRILKTLEHPHIVKVLEFLPDQGPALVMEHVDGVELPLAIRHKPLPPPDAIRITQEVLSALEAVHQRDVLHRDVKPSNVLLDRAGRVRLIDFGIAAIHDGPSHTRTMDAVGTLGFAAPEQLGRGKLGPATDLFAVGRLLEYMLTGEVTPPAAVKEALPSGLNGVVRRATQPEPNRRYGSAAEMRDALQRCAERSANGPPVALGDTLTQNYRIDAHVSHHDGIYVFEGIHLLENETVGLAVAVRSEPVEARLRDLVRKCPRHLLSFERPQLTEDHLLFVVFESSARAFRTFDALLQGQLSKVDRESPLVSAESLEATESAAGRAPEDGLRSETPSNDGRGGVTEPKIVHQLTPVSSPHPPGGTANPDELSLLDAAEAGDTRAQITLGFRYLSGRDGYPRDIREALGWFQLAAEAGESIAMRMLADVYEFGRAGKREPAKALLWRRKAAQNGDVGAMVGLANMYMEGKGTPKDHAEAARWYERAAEKGDTPSQAQFAAMLAAGRGVLQDQEQAAEWFVLAAEGGSLEAQVQLGRMHLEGRGVPESLAEAHRWFTLAARAGHPDALDALGQMYADGRGVPADIEEADRLRREAKKARRRYKKPLIHQTGEILGRLLGAAGGLLAPDSGRGERH